MVTNTSRVKMKTIKRETMSRQVINQIIELLMSGQLKPGDKLPTELELSEQLFVSRPVLREALSSLETIGIIHRKTRDGTYFSDKIGSEPYSIMLALSTGDIPSIMDARITLELGLVTMAAEKITDAQLSALEENLQAMAANKEEYTQIDREFHKIIAYSANNLILEGLIEPLLDMYDETLNQISIVDRDHARTLEQHRTIYEALTKRDPIEAFTSMYRHLSLVKERIRKTLAKKGDEV